MFTIYDYLDYYKNCSFEEVGFNQMDAMLFACLVYLPIKSFSENKSYKDFVSYAYTFYKDDYSGVMKPSSFALLNKIKTSKRYENIIISNFKNVRNNDTQFGAMSVRFNDNLLIAFKGSDSSLISWIENLRLNYQYPTYTQSKGIKYAKDNILDSDKNVYLVGHSKGGNLAMCAGMEIPSGLRDKVKVIYNFDGPGFLKKEYEKKFNLIKEKVVNIVPTGSVVGMCLYNDNFKSVKSKDLAFGEHYPVGWGVFGEFFVKTSLSRVSKQIHEMTTTNLDAVDKKQLGETIEELCKGLGVDYDSDFHLSMSEIWEIIRNMKGIDPKVYKYLTSVMQTLMKVK
ncbi:MAG: hypothetical protein DBY43_01090 [Clostridiaceae bacterium]|nr:MAG: hypothetical protein DBY43_01090 [Clostridiaceae bacterium]